MSIENFTGKAEAVEPNADMRDQLAITLAPYPNASSHCSNLV